MTAQLIIKCPEYLEEVRSFADRTNQRQQFENRLSDLTAYLPDSSVFALTGCISMILPSTNQMAGQ